MRTEATEKWVRGYVGTTAVVDTRNALLFWEARFPVPSYAFLRDDVRTDLLRPSAAPSTERSFSSPKGPVSEWYDVVVDDRVIEHAAWVRDDPAISDRIIVSWQNGLIDRWLEEDEVVFAHPRDPHKRVEALPSSRHVEVSLEARPGRLPLPRAALRDPSADAVLPAARGRPAGRPRPVVEPQPVSLQGHRRGVLEHARSGRRREHRVVLRCAVAAVARIADRIAFYNELVDITVNSVAQPRRSRSSARLATDQPADDEPYIDRMQARPAIAAAIAALVVLAAAAWWSFGDRSEESDNALTAVDDTEGEGVPDDACSPIPRVS